MEETISKKRDSLSQPLTNKQSCDDTTLKHTDNEKVGMDDVTAKIEFGSSLED